MPKTLPVTQKQWEVFDKEFMAHCDDLLRDRKREYAAGQDRHHNFNQAAVLQQVEVPAALRGMMVKHTVKLYDYIRAMSRSLEETGSLGITHAKLLEVCADQVNYVRLLMAWCKTYREAQQTDA